MKDKIKSKLQKDLESKGWKFLTNEDINIEGIETNDGLYLMKFLSISRTDSELENTYIGKGFNEVRVTDAYDVQGKIIPYAKAIYVK